MENKYYVPEIEELHIGFEYEVASSYCKNGIKQDDLWTERLVEIDIDFEYIEAQLEIGIIRVKYLDKEDIESLDWNHSGHTINEWYISKEDVEYKLTLYKDSEVRITDRYPNGITSSDKEEKYIYYGEIKNKLELQKLMKRLWIV